MKTFFVGDRRFVLEEMLKRGMNIEKCYVIENSYLSKEIQNIKINYHIISSKEDLLQALIGESFDLLISNGCPYILPISQMPQATYVNIHPSFLPDLRGRTPTVGSILFEKDSGATAHIMDDGTDTGEIISRVKIPFSYDLDVALLYQLVFRAEKEVFNKAFELNFRVQQPQLKKENHIYFSYSQKDRYVSCHEPVSKTIQRVKAFSCQTKGALLCSEGKEIQTFYAEAIENEYVKDICRQRQAEVGEVILVYEDCILVNACDGIVKFSRLPNTHAITEGSKIS